MTRIEDRWTAPGPQPNGLQATADGLWLIDQRDNHLYKLAYEDGAVIERHPTETDRSSGVTVGGGHVWVASTYSARLYKLNYDATTVEHYDTPGKGVVKFGNRDKSIITGAHGMEWVDDANMWVAVPPAQRVYLMDPRTMAVKRSIPTPGVRPHGLFMHEGSMWLGDTQDCKLHKLDPDSGQVLAEIDLPAPEVHGVTLHDGRVWFCCAVTRRVCTVPLPD